MHKAGVLAGCLLAALVFAPSWAVAVEDTVLFSFEEPGELERWFGLDTARLSLTAEHPSDGSYALLFGYERKVDGWPAVAVQPPGFSVTDWRPYSYFAVDVYNPEEGSTLLVLRLDDAAGRRFNRAEPIPPRQWVRWVIPLAGMSIDRSHITYINFHLDRPQTPGSLVLDNIRLTVEEPVPIVSAGTAETRRDPAVDTSASTTASLFGYDLAVVDTMTKVRIDAPYEGPRQRTATLSAARGEAEGFQILILAAKDLTDVRIEATDLIHAQGHGAIAADNVQFHQVGYVKTDWPFYGVSRAGWWPDPLLPVARFDVRAGDVQPAWVTITIPDDAPPGEYTGRITVRGANIPPLSVHVTLRVWSFSVPKEGSLPLAFTFGEHVSEQIHGSARWGELRRRYFDLIAEYRLAPDNIYRPTPPSLDDVLYWNERGLTAFNIMNVGNKPQYGQAEIDRILATIELALEQYGSAGLADKAYVYGFDEIGPDAYAGLKQIFGAVGERFPQLKRLSAMQIAEPVFGYVDAWANTIETYDPELARERRAAGEEVWMYLSISGRAPYLNWFIEYPAIQARLVWWLAYLWDVDGFLYYFINHYDYRSGVLPRPIDVHAGPYTDWDPASFVSGSAKFNGDGLLLYAGEEGPLPSLRLANIRDGLEDYEYLKLLERLLVTTGRAGSPGEAKEQVKTYVRQVITSATDYTDDPALLRRVRDEVAAAIESLLR